MSHRFLAYLRYVFAFAICFSAVPAFADPNVPKPVSFVTDAANLMNPADRNALESSLSALEKETTWEFWVVTIKTLEGATIERYAQDFFAENKIGKKGKNNGVLLLVARQERKVRIHSGIHAEGVIPDLLAKRILTEKFVPKSKAEDWSGACMGAGNEIIRLIRAEHAQPGQLAEQAAQSDTIMGMSPGVFVVVFFICLILLILFVYWLVGDRRGSGGYYSSEGGGFFGGGGGGGGDGFGGGGGDACGGGASSDC